MKVTLGPGVVVAAVLVAAACGAVPRWTSTTPAGPAIEYRLAPTADLRGLAETLCFRDTPPAALMPGTPDGLPGLLSARIVGGVTLAPDALGADSLRLPELPAGTCVVLDLALALGVPSRDAPYASRSERGAILPIGAWLWRPAELEAGFSATARFDLEPGQEVSVPWARAVDGGSYTLPISAFWRSGLAGLSSGTPPAIRRITLPGTSGTLEIVADPPELLPASALLDAWILAAASEVAGLYGRLPGGRVQVVVRGVPSREAVPFGQTFRGGGPAVALLVSRALDAHEAQTDWVAVHELFHLGLPVMRADDAWLFEGLASYYQNVLRARSGRLTPGAAWAQLTDGFQRGARVQTGRNLEDESREMHAHHAYWPVYWGGALWATRADLALRQARPGQGGLDEVMRLWARRRQGEDGAPERFEPYSALELLDAADESIGVEILGRSARETLARTDFLRFEDLDPGEWARTVVPANP